MTAAHQGIELKPLAGVDNKKPTAAPARVAERKPQESEGPPLPYSLLLTRHGADVLVHMERLFDEARRALIETPQTTSGIKPGTPSQASNTVASASRQPSTSVVRGN